MKWAIFNFPFGAVSRNRAKPVSLGQPKRTPTPLSFEEWGSSFAGGGFLPEALRFTRHLRFLCVEGGAKLLSQLVRRARARARRCLSSRLLNAPNGLCLTELLLQRWPAVQILQVLHWSLKVS
jgi:hypothetical protein